MWLNLMGRQIWDQLLFLFSLQSGSCASLYGPRHEYQQQPRKKGRCPITANAICSQSMNRWTSSTCYVQIPSLTTANKMCKTCMILSSEAAHFTQETTLLSAVAWVACAEAVPAPNRIQPLAQRGPNVRRHGKKIHPLNGHNPEGLRSQLPSGSQTWQGKVQNFRLFQVDFPFIENIIAHLMPEGMLSSLAFMPNTWMSSKTHPEPSLRLVAADATISNVAISTHWRGHCRHISCRMAMAGTIAKHKPFLDAWVYPIPEIFVGWDHDHHHHRPKYGWISNTSNS